MVRAARHPVRGMGWAAAALALVAMAVPAPASAVQELEWNGERVSSLTCGLERTFCGNLKAKVDVTADKGTPGAPWDEQTTIDLFPFRTAGQFRAEPEFPPASQLCTYLEISVTAAGPMHRTDVFAAVPRRLEYDTVAMTGNTATLTGRKCITYDADGARKGGVVVRPRTMSLDASGVDIDSVTIRAKTRLYLTPLFFKSSPWATDTIVFDDWTPPLARRGAAG